MKRVQGNEYTGFRVKDTGEGWYYVILADEKANEMRHYEYSGTYETPEQVEAWLEKHTYAQAVKHYKEMYVYCEAVEQIY